MVIGLVLAAVVLSLASCGAPVQSEPPWREQTWYDFGNVEFPSVGAEFGDIFFVDASHAWAVGTDWTVASTSNGGADWEVRDPLDPGARLAYPELHAVWFTDASHGWVTGNGGAIFATTDGGASWHAQDYPGRRDSDSVLDITFADASHGWAAVLAEYPAEDFILATTDGGATWKRQWKSRPLELPGDIAAIDFPDATHGWAVGRNGFILATTNGGVSWSRQWCKRVSGRVVDLIDLSFADATHGWVVGWIVGTNGSSGKGVVLATTDGGASWALQHSGRRSLWGVDFFDKLHGWVVGYGGGATILATSDGGESWIKQTSGTSGYLGGVNFVDATHGWAVGGDADNEEPGIILATSNGGE